MKAFDLICAVALVVLAVVVLAIPESRTLPVRVGLIALYVIVVGQVVWRVRKWGVLRKTIPQMHLAIQAPPNRVGISFLTFAARMLGVAAILVIS